MINLLKCLFRNHEYIIVGTHVYRSNYKNQIITTYRCKNFGKLKAI